MIHIENSATGTSASSVAYRNVMAEGALWASSETADGFAANALGPATFDAWVPAAMPAILAVTLTDSTSCECAAIIAHTLGSSGATVAVERRQTLAGAWITVATVTPEDDRDIFVLFGEEVGVQWRFVITGPTPPAVGIAWIGPRLLIPGGVAAGYVPVNLALDVELSPSSTIRGQYVGTYEKRKGAGTSIPLAAQERWWVQSEAAPFIAHYNAGKPFLWMSCPDLLPEDGSYCWRDGNTLSANFGAGTVWASMTMQVSAYVS